MDVQPLVSVIIITRNRPHYLKLCLHHLKEQDYDNFEIVVVDSSTNRESQKIIDEYPEIKYVSFFNGKNMPISRNIGIENSRGDRKIRHKEPYVSAKEVSENTLFFEFIF